MRGLQYGELNPDNVGKTHQSILEKAGFVWHTKDAKYIPKRGDILVQHEHYGKEAQVWSWGKVYKSLPAPRTKSGLYGRTSGYWRIEK